MPFDHQVIDEHLGVCQSKLSHLMRKSPQATVNLVRLEVHIARVRRLRVSAIEQRLILQAAR